MIYIKKSIANIYDTNPEWTGMLISNPNLDIINKGKTYHLINFLINVCGAVRSNPLIKDINYSHYKQQEIIKVIDDIKKNKKKLSEDLAGNPAHCMDILSLVSKIHYFCIYYQSATDGFIKGILKYNYISRFDNLSYQSKLIFYLIKLGYQNIHIEKVLKKIQGYQNKDGGWPVSLKNKKSDIFTTLLIHRCYLENNLWKNKDFLKKSENYLIKNHMSESNSSEELDRWNRIYIGYRKNNLFEGGSVLLLDSLLITGRKIKNIKTILRWLKSLQLKNGLFPYHAKLKNQPNLTSTISILSLFKKAHLFLAK